MSTIDEILGRKPVQEDEPPVQASRTRPASPARRLPPTDKEDKKLRNKARQSSVVAGIIGMAESDEEAIIPNDAKRVDPYNTGQIPGMREQPDLEASGPAEPTTNVHGEELIPPTAALVAPDVTPNIFQLIDPSQVPAPPQPTAPPPGAPTVTPAVPTDDQGALDTLLGRTSPSPQTPAFAVESFVESINPLEVKTTVAEKLVPASEGGSSMPEHRQGDGKTIFSTFRRLVG